MLLAQRGRMVARLHEALEQADLPPRALRGLREHLLKQRLRHELAARARHKEAARLRQLHAAAVQLTIAPIGAVEGAAALGKGGRIADDEAVFPAFVGV